MSFKELARRIARKLGIEQWLRFRRDERRFGEFLDDDLRRAHFYKQFFSSGDLVFDVGANQGNRSKVFLHLGARVVAFEPQKPCIRFLRSVFRNQPEFHLEELALGPEEKETVMLLSNSHHLSSLSPEWISSVKRSGRFQDYNWDRRQRISVSTLDKMIAKYGVPKFLKIDVEGYEFEVLSGLTQSVPFLSIEFTPEYIESTFRCIQRLRSFGPIALQLSLGESMEFVLLDWITPDEMTQVLRQQPATAFGDVYIRSETSHVG